MSTAVSERSQVVIVGGGIMGCALAYNLTKVGLSDVVVLERHQLTSGTTWHAAGLVGQLRATENLTRLARYSIQLYRDLEAETGQATGFRTSGAISLAATGSRWEELRRTAAMARHLEVEAEEIGPGEIGDRFPLCETTDLVGGIWLPHDSVVAPADLTMALAKGARAGGARLIEGVGVETLAVADGRCSGVVLDNGETIEAETVVLTAGLWTRALAAGAGVAVPLQAAEHYYVVTEPVEGCDPRWPVLRDLDRWSYLKPEAGGSMLVGLFEPEAIPWPETGAPPTDRSFITFDPDPEHLGRWLPAALDRIPALADAGLRLVFGGPESFTPDDSYILGEVPSLPGLFVAAGFNSIGIQSAGGAGMALAHWIVDGRPPLDLSDVDIRRFEPFQATERYLRERTVEGLGLLYAPHWPHYQYETARSVRRSPLHHRLAERGACFGSLAGWERPMFYANPDLGVEPCHEYSWGRQNWHPATAVEHAAVRQGTGLFDLSSFTKFSVQGPDAAAVLDRLSAGAVAGETGRSVYTQWLNDTGGIEADLTISRLADDEFWVIGATATRTRDRARLDWALATHPGGAAATVTDITSGWAVLAVMGPRSREVLEPLTAADLSEAGFGFGTHREIELGAAIVRANRISYVGELGWELFVPSEFAVYVFDLLVEAGTATETALVLCGYHALDSLRIEKGFRHWGHDITPDDNPVQAGLSFAVAWEKPVDFIGRSAVEAERVAGATRRLVQIAVPDDRALLHHHEPLCRDGERVGYVTSGMWGHTVGAAVGMGWASRGEPVTADWVEGGDWTVELPGREVEARVQLQPLL
ncbi:MAG: FAD-dependent oxidoreductase [Acidimicrobiia bacterium]|nr:FAD-dependent oxidoreductase [Acidimicrobiia bacterium]